MKLTKAQRATLREKFGGRCAYCGQLLGDRWYAYHIEYVERKLIRVPGKGVVCTGEMHRPERDTIENLNPACAPCNIDKHSFDLETWRGLIQRSNEVPTRDVSTFRRALRYGMVTVNPDPVVFYFELFGDRAAAALAGDREQS